ncbi:hypothetical protein ACSVH2_07620 [Flavobacterium sp. RSB2_4_14]|uniref:hypothetical protein n=1 Tax=Flavobacterium sp. RSB2_4_14 TaxID=3447665 RepID=UPI003F3CA9D0
MKKIITLFAVVFLLSCSKDDDGTKAVTFQNLTGQWKFKSIVRANGTVIPYTGLCPTQTDYIEIFSYRKIVTYNYYPDCINTENFGCSDYTLTEDDMIYGSSFLFDEAIVTNLTSSGFKIEFTEPRSLTFMININDAKTVIFEKR